MDAPETSGSLGPEIDGHQHRHIAAEAVDGVLRDPELHGVALRPPHVAVGVVELRGVGPVPRHGRLPRSVAFVPRGVLFGDPPGVTGRMVGHPIEQYLYAEAVGFGDEGVEIGHRAQFGIHGAVVADRIVGAQRAFAPGLPDRIDRHQPHGIDAEVSEERKFRGGGAQRAFGRELAHVHFIENGLVAPFGMQVHATIEN